MCYNIRQCRLSIVQLAEAQAKGESSAATPGAELEPRTPAQAAEDKRQERLREINAAVAYYYHNLLVNALVDYDLAELKGLFDAATPPVEYPLLVGLYDPMTGERLPVTGRDVNPAGNAVYLGTVKVVTPNTVEGVQENGL